MVSTEGKFEIEAGFTPTGDQPAAIRAISSGLREDLHHQTLLGVTGSGKTFTMAQVIEQTQRPSLILAPNKTLAAQLYGLDIIALRLGDILDVTRGTTKWSDKLWKRSMATGSWVHRYDVGEACVHALEVDHKGFDVYHLVGAPSAKKRFDVARAEGVLGIRFTTESDRRPASER